MRLFSIFVLPFLIAATYGPAAPAPRDRPALLNWLKQSDYPAESLAAHEQGEVTAAFDVTETGAVENCKVIRSSGYLRLDDATCPLIEERARYRPAVDGAGKPMRSADVRAFRWIAGDARAELRATVTPPN